MHRRVKSIGPLLVVIGVVIVAASIAGVGGITGSKNSTDRDYASREPISRELVTGKGAMSTRVINGAKVTPAASTTRWRSIGYLFAGGYQCGATLISPRYAVTAAHCVTEGTTPFAIEDVGVAFGMTSVAPIRTQLQNARSLADVPALIPAASVTVHPGWNPDTFRNDVAVIQLVRDATVPPTPLIGPSERGAWGAGAGRSVTGDLGPWIGGWGVMDRVALTTSDDLLEAKVPIIADNICGQQRRTFDRTVMLCAGILDTDGAGNNTTNGVDTCQGDSGGPLFTAVADGSMRLTGIVSFGGECAGLGYGIYSRVDGLRSWIETITGPVSGTTTMPSATVVGGGGGGAPSGGDVTLLTIAEGATVKNTPAKVDLTWHTRTGAEADTLTLKQGSRTIAQGAVDGAIGARINPAGLPWGPIQWCVSASDPADGAQLSTACRTFKRSAQHVAQITGVRVRGKRAKITGKVASNTRAVFVTVRLQGGGASATTKRFQVTLPGTLVGRSFSQVVTWKGRAPRTLTATTTVTGGGATASFRTPLS